MKTFDFPKKAYKQCQKCLKYVHARSLLCICGHEFGKPKEKPEPKIYDSPKQGRKQCPSCSKYIGAKSLKCPNCNNEEFETGKINKTTLIKPVTKNLNYVGNLVLTPSGQCPVSLTDPDKESVFYWCEQVFLAGLKQRKTYTENALKYWCHIENPEPKLKEYIHEWCYIGGYEAQVNKTGSNNQPEFDTST